ALMMQLGADGVFVGSGIFKSENPKKRARAVVEAVNNYTDATVIANASKSLGEAMPGLDIHLLTKEEILATRGN
ncbi:MAG: pyridoxal 5'-phosphate synthase lyase subunit PdxS, partial [Methanoregula sp.]|nr:pyridoxal 5'-phosphate synthase lyase subunit PdxS [Methanoregula sp.]